MAHGHDMTVEVVYALPDKAWTVCLQITDGSTAADVIRQSGLLEKFPEIDLAVNRIGIFSKPCSLETPLQEGDRLEIYRPLQVDPKEARRRRAQKKKQENA